MDMLSELDSESVRDRLARLKGSLEVVFHPASEGGAPPTTKLAEVARRIEAASGGGVSVQRGDGAGLVALPALTIAHRGCGRIHYQALPDGPEALPFLEALLGPGRGSSESPESWCDRLADLQQPAELLVFVASSCPHCPSAVRVANGIALANPRVTTSIVDVEVHSGLAERYKARAVPLTVLDGGLSLTGVISAADLGQWLLDRGSREYPRRVFLSLIEYGRFSEAVEQVIAGPGAAHLLAAWETSDTSLRIGLMMAVDEVLARDRAALDSVVPGLLPQLRSEDAGLRGDTADLLGRIGHADATEELRALLGDANADVAEIASEALDEIHDRNQ